MHSTTINNLIRRFTLIEILHKNDSLPNLLNKCLQEAESFFEEFNFYLIACSSNKLNVLYKSSTESPITIDRIQKSIRFFSSSEESKILISYSKHKVLYQSLPSNMYIAVSVPRDSFTESIRNELTAMIIEISIIIAKKDSKMMIGHTTKVEDGIEISDFETFYRTLTSLFIEDKSSCYSALIFIDFERFSSAKDVIRFSFNDDILSTILEHIKVSNDENVLMAKVEHDLLAILIKDFTQLESIAFEYISKAIQDFRIKLKEQLKIDSQRFFLTFKAGIRLFNRMDFNTIEPERKAKALIKQTEFAMDMVNKDSKTPYLFFTDELLTQYQRRNAIEIEIKNALEKGEFYLVYQPIVNIERTIIGAEALLRWKSKKLGHISPNEFIPIAEQSGLVIDIGNFVAEQVCEALSRDLCDVGYISINVSCIQLKDTMFGEKISYLLAKYPKCRERLRIELTESVAMTNLKNTQLIINALQSKGVLFMLDDFGTGHSSLAYLNELSLHTIKIDRIFVDGVSQCAKKQAIVSTVQNLAKSFNLECIVEGVERNCDFDFLKNNGINSFQGFLFSKPISKFDLIGLMSTS